MEHPIGRGILVVAVCAAVAIVVAYGFCSGLNEILRLQSCDSLVTRVDDLARTVKGYLPRY